MKTRIYVILCVTILIALGVMRHSRQRERSTTTPQSQTVTKSSEPAQRPSPMLPPAMPPLTRVAQAPQTNTPASEAPPKSTAKLPKAQAAAPTGGKEVLQDPLARAALTMVGMDPAAEEYWAVAINDPNLSDKEREDLIEDLNEEGFEDPQNPTLDELPLIVNRLQIIEHYAPSAMDQNNARSFAEAYKDLANMFFRLTAQ